MSAAGEPYGDNRSLAGMVKGLVSDVTTLFRQEIELAKTEAGERVESAVHGGQMLVAIVVLGTAWLVSIGMEPMTANVISAVVVALVVGLIGWIMISAGIKRLKTSNFKLERTAHSLSEDANVVKERL
jgi:hypothetical protein